MGNIHKLDIDGNKIDQLVSRWLDDEMTAEERGDFERRLSLEPALAERLAQFTRADEVLCELLSDDRISVNPDLAAKLSAPLAPTVRPRRTQFAIAASIALAAVVSLSALQPILTSPRDGATTMDAALAEALETLPSRAEGWDTLSDGSQLRAVLTFPSANGTWCREFMLAKEADHWRGVACRHSGSWVTQVMAREVFLENDLGYRPAGAADSDSVARFVDEQSTDIALSAAQEATIMASDWHMGHTVE